ncbi:MAG: GAF domain-containing protein [Prevotellaceae bacterium]|jgi:GAF domain-containing protein|nr:GAF domain-containing protein [Prevotellaceae bacterium]
MAEDLNILPDANREERYKNLLPQVKSLVEGENDVIANMANIAAAIKETFSFLWVGFYLVKNDELVLGPFQGPVACTRIKSGKGVCGTAWEQQKTLIVPDVNTFPGHIACSSRSFSEIVLPITKNGKTIGVLDIDSELLNDFSELDKHYLEQIVAYL